ncbi:protein maelstrom homolog isoform X2 [Mixophyes fleayi]|uniref:protein maelstrom homolog isoform X2 n=1 Tax=Mixophyes fleayi TaxID=3061075 RepID=UPI003F4DDC92
MPNKKSSRNAYFFFVLDMIPVLRQRGHQVSGVREAIPLCSADWALLTAHERESYSEKAKAWRSREPDPPSPQADLGHFGHGKEQQREASREAVRRPEQAHKRIEGMDKNVIYVINVFSHGEMPSLCDQRFVPCEVGCVRYSLQSGIMNSFHDFIDPGELPFGFRYHCQAGSAATHQIPVSGFELANKDYHNLFRSLCEFVCPAPALWTPVYCKNNDIYRVKWCLQWLADKAGIKNDFQLLDIESLIIAFYKNKLEEEPSRSSVHRLLDVVHWDYANNTRCKWHEDNDMWCCALASCRKITYCISKALASVYDVVLTPAHLPNLQPEGNQASGNAKTIVLDAKRYQKNMDHQRLSDRFTSAGSEHESSTSRMGGLTPNPPSKGRGRGILRLLEEFPASFTTNE